MRAYTAQKLKAENRQRAFLLIAERRALSKSELASTLGFSAPTAGKIIDDFLQKGIVREAGAVPTEFGRPPYLMELVADAGFYAGVVVEGAYIKIGILNLAHELVAVSSHCCEGIPLDRLIAAEVSRHIAALSESAGINPRRIMGAGLGIPGICDKENGVVLAAPLIGIREPMDISASLSSLSASIGCPVLFDNDTNMAAVGENLCRGSEADDLLFVSLGTGLGSAILIDGGIVRGSRNRAGEIGYCRNKPAIRPTTNEAGWLESAINIEAACKMSGVRSLDELKALDEAQKNSVSKRIAELLTPCLSTVALALDLSHICVSGLLPDALGASFFYALNSTLAGYMPFPVQAFPSYNPNVDIIGAAGAAFSGLLSHMLAD